MGWGGPNLYRMAKEHFEKVTFKLRRMRESQQQGEQKEDHTELKEKNVHSI